MLQVEILYFKWVDSSNDLTKLVNAALSRLSGIMTELRDIKYISDNDGCVRTVVIEYYANGGA